MLRSTGGTVKPSPYPSQAIPANAPHRLFAHPPRPRQTGTEVATGVHVTALLLLLAAAVAALLAWLLLRGRRPDPQQRAMRQVLDAADALEARLRTAREEIEAVTGEQGPDPVGMAMREMLRQRVWLRDHGEQASVEQLAGVRVEIDAARGRIEQQLSQIERARQAEPS